MSFHLLDPDHLLQTPRTNQRGMQRLIERYRLPEHFVKIACDCDSSQPEGFFSFGEGITCFGACKGALPVATPAGLLPDVHNTVRHEADILHLPFDPDQVLDALLLERYPAGGRNLTTSAAAHALYYRLRPTLPVCIRRHFQMLYLAGWEAIQFPHWPVDCTVERFSEELLALMMRAQGIQEIPFVWFWPKGHESCAIVTHDVETPAGRDFCGALMNLDDSFGVKSSFQLIPENRYAVSDKFLAGIRSRGFEVNVHDLTHDGSLFQDHASFMRQVMAVNRYGKRFGAAGFRAGAMRRNQRWYDALEFAYDMSVPNAAHLEPQRGGCCTVLPYFIGNLIELPTTTTQDYALFHFVRDRSLELWKRQVELIRQKHGLISFLVHPDYIREKWAQQVYLQLLQFIAELREHRNVWTATPGEVNDWWRVRSGLQVVHDGKQWQIEGAGSEQASIAFAFLDGDRITYRMDRPKASRPADSGAWMMDVSPVSETSLAPVPDKKLNVCILAYTHYEGDNRVMRYAETLAARGDHVDVIALRRSDTEADSLINGVNVIKIQTRIRNEKGKRAYLFRLLAFLSRSAWILAKRHRLLHYDLIHVHSVPDFLVLAALFPKLRGAKVILDIHDILPEFYASKFHRSQRSAAFKSMVFVERVSARLAHHVIIANDLWRERLIHRSIPGHKCTTILNFPDRNIFRQRGRTRSDGRFVMLYPGSLNSHQGVDVAIRALGKISEQVPQADFHIYGQGPDRARLIELVCELGLEKRVFVHDPLPLRDIAHVMEEADLGVVPKRGDSFGNEAFSTKTLEFMSLGVPLIVAATAIDKYYFDDTLVRYFRSGDEDDLAAAMLELIRNRKLREQLVQKGLEFASANDWETHKRKYLDLVAALIP